MSRNLRSLASSSEPASPWLARQEQEAERAAALPAPQAARPALTGAPVRDMTRLGASIHGAGQPLPHAAAFGATLGHDFSRVRVHTDARAAEAADGASARAFTHGNHIVFGAGQFQPHTPEGRRLLTHELTHAAQQGGARDGAGVVQCDPKPGAKGIGSAPPLEPFSIEPGVGEEDNHLLFGHDSADLPADAGRKLAGMVKDQKKPVTVVINGYSSIEGDAEYNVNLSAHRAAAVKALLLPLLPPGSQVVLTARGTTDAFGAHKDNRRAGVKINQGVAAGAQEGEPGKEEWRLTLPQLSWPGAGGPPLGLGLQLTPPSLSPPQPPPTLLPIFPHMPPPGMGPSRPSWATLPADLNAPPTSLMDWSSLTEPFRSRGLRLSDRDSDSITQTWVSTYQMYFNLGFPRDMAASIANMGTSAAYGKYMEREFPTPLDKMNADWEMYKKIEHPDEFVIPPIPVISPTTLEWLIKKTTGKDVELNF